jgi:LPS-assembly lipoprotein
MWWSEPRRARAVGAASAAILVAALLSGCGFHLRGDVRYPPGMAVTYIEAADRYTPFYQGLKIALRDGGVRVTTDPNAAGAVIRVLHDETGQRVLSVSARNTPTEYDVFYMVRYALDIGGREALPPQTLTLTRDYTYDEMLVLGKSSEEQTIRRAIADDLVGLVTRRLSSVE